MTNRSIRMLSGLLIVFEGIDGSGKSVQARLLAEDLGASGFSVTLTAEPTHGPIGMKLRTLKERLSPEEELELFLQDRRDHIRDVIEPGLSKGKIIICDRYVHSTVAYQGARGLDPELVWAANDFAPKADLVFLLQVPVKECLIRIATNRGDNFTAFEKQSSLQKVVGIYEQMNFSGLIRINGCREIQVIRQEIRGIVKGKMHSHSSAKYR